MPGTAEVQVNQMLSVLMELSSNERRTCGTNEKKSRFVFCLFFFF